MREPLGIIVCVDDVAPEIIQIRFSWAVVFHYDGLDVGIVFYKGQYGVDAVGVSLFPMVGIVYADFVVYGSGDDEVNHRIYLYYMI